MTVRLDVTTATGEGTSFTPGDDFTVQVQAGHGGAVFDVLARVDAAAPWETIGMILPADKFGRFADMPLVKIAVRENKAGAAAKAWTDK